MAEFKIGRLRYTWKGYWATGTFYNRDAIVAFNGKTYVCLVPHTSGDFYTDVNHYDPVAGSTPYWSIMLDGTQWTGNWQPNTEYTLGNIVLYTGTLYECVTNHTSGATTIDLQNWEIYVTVNSTWAGNYSPDTYYRIGEVVKYNGIVYKCTEEHTSSSFNTIDYTKWSVLHVGIEYKSAWDSNGVEYRKNDIVKFGPDIWIAKNDHVSILPFDDTQWDLWIPGIDYGTTWDAITVYQIGDVVKYGGYAYINKITNNTGIVPSLNDSGPSAAWELLNISYDLQGDWLLGVSYKVGSTVRRGGSVFSAIADNTDQDPTDFSISKTYVATGSSGLTVKLSNTTGLVPGMIVSGNGFNKGQFITSITNSTTIVVSQEPYTSIVDGTSLAFTGVNSSYWELVSAGVKWRNRWTNADTYIIGDVAVWKNTTYRCIKTHVSNDTLRPDLDITRAYWIVYFNHDQYNVLNKNGDIVVNSSGTNTALGIGAEGFLLKSIYGIPTWSNVFQTPAVYYVTPDGTDLPTSGDTWDNPYQSIRYACNRIAQGTANINLKSTVTANKDFIIAEVNNWVQYQVSNLIAPFNLTDVIDSEKTKRDTSFLLDAIIYDLSRGGNSQTIAFVYTFFDKEYSNQYATTGIELLVSQFVAAISHTFSILLDVLAGTTVTPSYQVLNNALVILSQTSSLPVDSQAITDVQSLGTIITTALTAGNTSTIPAENQGLTATLMIKTGTYEETLPILVPANTALVGDELRGSVIRPKNSINVVATRSQAGSNLITVPNTNGMTNGTPVQFASMNPITGVSTVFGGLNGGQTYYIIGSSVTGTQFSVSETVGGPAVSLTTNVSRMHVYGGDALSDMFHMQNGTGLRNVTLTGLLGTLSDQNAYTTRRPTGGAYVSLDPGTGPSDTSAWIYRKSPYIQNVTTFGIGATGLKIDGNLHNGGYKSAVCNDFTQIISDGIGVWCTGPDSLCEAVSVFSYYGYAGYFSEDGGRIRATNGNSSYGTFGVVAEGYDINESPITGEVDNRYYEAAATPVSSLGSAAEILKLQFSHAGENYSTETTNLLTYSNLFTNWSTDTNVTLIQSIVSPSTRSDGWIATGNTSGTDSSYIYQNITVAPSGATYTALSGDSQTGGGINATFDVTVTSTQYIVTVNNGGSGYVTTNQIQINGSRLGGLDGVNDLIITVTSLSGTSISTITSTGTVQVGSTQPYTFSLYCKKGTSTSIDVTATFSGYSSVTSGIGYNFTTEEITPYTANGGMTPTMHTHTPVSGTDGWYRISFQFYDVTALNNSLQIRIYPRSRLGNTAYTMIYGAQLEVGGTLGFYLKTNNQRFTAHANFDVFGAGSGVDLIGDEIRSDSVYQTRILSASGITGGKDYLVSSNNAQSGDSSSIVIAGSDVAGEKDYLGMRLFVNSGAGAGQYGVISTFDTVSKNVGILRESFSPVTITNSTTSTNVLTLDSAEDVNTLYVNQPVRFIPTSYSIAVTNISQKSIQVTATFGGSINTIKVTSTARLAVNMPITFSGSTYGGVTSNFTYYVLNIIDDLTIQVSTSLGGAAVLLNSDSGTMALNYPASTSYLVGSTTNMAINLPIYFTGDVFSDVVAGQTYYINEIYNSNEFTISSNIVTATASNTVANTNYVTVGDSSVLRAINPITFVGTNFGNISANTKYYVNHIIDSTRITLSSTVIDTIASSSVGSSNLINVADTTGFIIGNPVVLTGTTFGGITNDKIYYVHYVNNSTSFTISNTSTPITVTATQTFVTTNNITVNSTANLMPLNPIKFNGTTFGGISIGVEYYINRIIDATTMRISSGVISVTATATEETSNLITVTSTVGFTADNPIIFGGNTLGGLVSGTVYYVSAINNSTTFTVSTTPGGAAVTLTSATGAMTARTTTASLTLSSATGSLTGLTRYTGSPVDLSTGVGECYVRTTGASVALTTAAGSLAGTSTSVKEILSAATGTMTATYSVPVFGSVVEGTTYYVKTITPGSPNTYTISAAPGGAAVSLTTSSGSMKMAEVGWDHINPGTPLAVSFDSTTVYSIEPLVTYSKPGYSTSSNSNVTAQAPGTQYVSIAYGNDKFVALPNGNSILSTSVDGSAWMAQLLPSAATWSDLAYGNKYWVIISSGGSGIPGSKVLYSNSNLVTWKTSYLPSIGSWSKVVYGNGKFVAIGGTSSAASTNFGATWTNGTINADTWTGLAYGSGLFVAVSPTNSKAAYSTNGTSWTVVSLPRSATWSSVEFGNGRFVAIASSGGLTAYSFDGATWYESRYAVTGSYLSYGNGIFLATSSTGTTGYISEDGIVWLVKTVPTSTNVTTFGFDSTNKGRFIGVSGQSSASIVNAGSQTKARVTVYQDTITGIYAWDSGSNYSNAPTVTIVDSNATKPAVVSPALGDGVLGNPTFYSNGSGYNTLSTSIIITGDGYAESYQTGRSIIFKHLTKLPSAGDNLTIDGDSTVYKVTYATLLDGSVTPNIRAKINISPSMSVADSPVDSASATIRTKYSQVRLTNHDFLNVGYGNMEQSNYPNVPSSTLLSPENEAVESNYGRVFYSSTDQDGNFRVGKLFAVEQATGIVTLSASQFGLDGLGQLRLGGIAIGGNSVIVTQFSTDSTFVANSNNIVPTQKAIKSYLTARLSQGGSNTFTGQLIAGTVLIGGPDKIASTIPEGNEGSHVTIPVKVNVKGQDFGMWDGDGMAVAYFMRSFLVR